MPLELRSFLSGSQKQALLPSIVCVLSGSVFLLGRSFLASGNFHGLHWTEYPALSSWCVSSVPFLCSSLPGVMHGP